MSEKKQKFLQATKKEITEHKVKFFVYLTLRFFVVVSLVLSLIRNEYENAFVCVLCLLLFLVPTFLEKRLKIDLPSTVEIIILLFIFSAEILGEIHNYYAKVPYWDTVLHVMNGFLFSAFGFSLLDIMNRNSKFKFQLSPLYLTLVAFCFSMTIGVLWEFFEFGCDIIFATDMQKDFIMNTISSVKLNPSGENIPTVIENIRTISLNGQNLEIGGYLDVGLYDTMKDLIVNFLGAATFSIIGFFYIKNRGRGEFAKQFIPTIEEDE